MKGIYILTNLVNGKQYVGKDVNLLSRANRHLRGGCENCRLIHRAIKKYGSESFSVEVIPYPGVSHEALYAIEQWKIAQLGSRSPHGYNLTDGGPGRSGLPHSAETKRLLSLGKMGDKNPMKRPEMRKMTSHRCKGQKLSAEHRQKIGDAHRGEKHHYYGKQLSAEHRAKLSAFHKGKTISESHRKSLSESGKRGWIKRKHNPAQLTLFD